MMRTLSCFAIIPSNRETPSTVLMKDQRNGLVEQPTACEASQSCEAYRKSTGLILNYDDVYKYIVQGAIDEVNRQNAEREIHINCIRAVDIPKSGSILPQMTKKICESEITITDITSLNPNVLFELGIRLAVKDDLNLLICHEGTVIPFNIKDYRFITYRTDFSGQMAKEKIVVQINAYLNESGHDAAAANAYYRDVGQFTGRDAGATRLAAFEKTPELVARLASMVFKAGSNLSLKNEIRKFFESVGQTLKAEPRKAVTHFELLRGIEGLSEEDKANIAYLLHEICSPVEGMEEEAKYYLSEVEKFDNVK